MVGVAADSGGAVGAAAGGGVLGTAITTVGVESPPTPGVASGAIATRSDGAAEGAGDSSAGSMRTGCGAAAPRAGVRTAAREVRRAAVRGAGGAAGARSMTGGVVDASGGGGVTAGGDCGSAAPFLSRATSLSGATSARATSVARPAVAGASCRASHAEPRVPYEIQAKPGDADDANGGAHERATNAPPTNRTLCRPVSALAPFEITLKPFAVVHELPPGLGRKTGAASSQGGDLSKSQTAA